MCPAVIWKAEVVINLIYLAKEISEQRVESAACFLLVYYSKIQGEIDKIEGRTVKYKENRT